MIRRLGLSLPLCYLRGGERDWRLNQSLMASDLINHTYIKNGVQRASWLVNMWMYEVVRVPQESMEASASFHIPCPIHLLKDKMRHIQIFKNLFEQTLI